MHEIKKITLNLLIEWGRIYIIILLEIARKSKRFTNGRECTFKVANVWFSFWKSIKQNILLCRNTITFTLIFESLVLQLKKDIKEFTNFSLAADESTDNFDTAQFVISIWGIEMTEELLVLLKGSVTSK